MYLKSIKSVFVLFIVFLSSFLCSSQNVKKLLKKGSIEDKVFKSTFKYEPYGNAIFVKVLIKGKTYRLLFDTGAVTAISPRMVEELNLEIIGKEEVYDLGNTSRNLNFVKMDTINLNGIKFFDTGAAVLDIEAVKDFKCTRIDGFLGANFMRNAVWEVDMAKHEITFTNTIDAISIPEDAPYTKIFIGYDGTPAITAYLGNEKLYSTMIDYGYGGGISLFSYDFKKLREENTDIKYVQSNGGSTLAGVYGDIKTSTTYKVIVDNFKTGDFEAPSTLMSFGQFGSRTIGAGFLKNYRVVLSWKDRKAWFIENKIADDQIIFSGHGYGIRLENESIFISSISENSEAEEKGLKINDKILSVNDVDFTKVTDQKWCEILSTNRPDKVKLVIQRDTKQLTVALEKKVLLSN
ncbi:aspartyl protease family protein [Olleya namhaensis]|uniref:aspartyl protease family protein n=1 Tax=Olleya namhaensis TaxID=1144750 RepID=UPI002491C1C5|nr:aspartyl protease family protein [Olleya namhaensis]